MKCDNCNTSYYNGDKFCFECGAKLGNAHKNIKTNYDNDDTGVDESHQCTEYSNAVEAPTETDKSDGGLGNNHMNDFNESIFREYFSSFAGIIKDSTYDDMKNIFGEPSRIKLQFPSVVACYYPLKQNAPSGQSWNHFKYFAYSVNLSDIVPKKLISFMPNLISRRFLKKMVVSGFGITKYAMSKMPSKFNNHKILSLYSMTPREIISKFGRYKSIDDEYDYTVIDYETNTHTNFISVSIWFDSEGICEDIMISYRST